MKVNKQLMAAATERAKDMAKTGVFSHDVATTTPGVTRDSFIRNAGYPMIQSGENLATLFDDPRSMLDAWKKSPGHNANLVKNYDEVGVALVPVTYKGRKTQFVVQFFGTARRPQVVAEVPKNLPNMAQPSPKMPATLEKGILKKAQTKLGSMKSLPVGGVGQTTPQVIPNNKKTDLLSLIGK